MVAAVTTPFTPVLPASYNELSDITPVCNAARLTLGLGVLIWVGNALRWESETTQEDGTRRQRSPDGWNSSNSKGKRRNITAYYSAFMLFAMGPILMRIITSLRSFCLHTPFLTLILIQPLTFVGYGEIRETWNDPDLKRQSNTAQASHRNLACRHTGKIL